MPNEFNIKNGFITSGNSNVYANLNVTGGLTATTISATTYFNLPFSGSVIGSGTTGYLPKWTGSTGLSNSLVYDSTTGVTIGTGFTWNNTNGWLSIKKTNPAVEIDVTGSIRASSTVFTDVAQFNFLQTSGSNLLIRGSGGTSYATMFQTTGNFVLQNGGTFTDTGYRLDVVGSDARFNSIRVGRGGGNQPSNTAVGDTALSNNTTGTANTAVGYLALGSSNTAGTSNSAFGYLAMRFSSGGSNSAFGTTALYGMTSGSNNSAFGRDSGYYIADGTTALLSSSGSLFLGANTKALAAGSTNEIVIGYNAIGLGSNSVVLGNSGITKTALQGNILIGKTTDSGQKLQVSGDTLISGGLTATTISATTYQNLPSFTFTGGTVSGATNFTGGLSANTISATTATIRKITGGSGNTNSGIYSFIGGGVSNSATQSHSLVSGGLGNTVSGQCSAVVGGQNNIVSGNTSTISGGYSNINGGAESFIGAGRCNTIGGNAGGVIGGGTTNTVSANYSFIGGGTLNTSSGYMSTVVGGLTNTGSGNYSFIGGGRTNTSSGYYSTIGGGNTNCADGINSTIAGGDCNYVSSKFSAIGGGTNNTAKGTYATAVFGGAKNSVDGDYSFIGGGYSNTVSGKYSGVLGGCGNTVSGDYSFAAGCGITASVNNTFYANNFCSSSGTISATGTKGTVVITGNSSTAMINVSGSNTVGGTGYTDFIRVVNTAAGATNETKTIRVNITGGIEFLNSAYLAQTLTLTDGGILYVGGGNTAVTANNDPGTNYLSFNNNGTSIYDDGNTHIHSRSNGGSMWINTNNGAIILGNQSPVLGGGAASGIIMGSGSTTVRAFANIYGGKTYTIGGYGYLATIGAGTGVGTTATYGLYVQQRVEATEFDATSDERLKNIQGEIELDDAIKLVNNLKPIKFTWKDKDNEGIKAGYSAQQVVKSGFNHLIGHIKNEDLIETTDDEGFTSPEGFQLTMNYDQVTPYHGVVIKHLLNEIDNLKKEIEILKSK
jgi:hypothetical protein